jgi:hypothetical protein
MPVAETASCCYTDPSHGRHPVRRGRASPDQRSPGAPVRERPPCTACASRHEVGSSPPKPRRCRGSVYARQRSPGGSVPYLREPLPGRSFAGARWRGRSPQQWQRTGIGHRQRLVEVMGGPPGATSTQGEGTCIRFRLSAAREPPQLDGHRTMRAKVLVVVRFWLRYVRGSGSPAGCLCTTTSGVPGFNHGKVMKKPASMISAPL